MSKPIPGQPMIPGAPGWEYSLRCLERRVRELTVLGHMTSFKQTDTSLVMNFQVHEDLYQLMQTYAQWDVEISEKIRRNLYEVERN